MRQTRGSNRGEKGEIRERTVTSDTSSGVASSGTGRRRPLRTARPVRRGLRRTRRADQRRRTREPGGLPPAGGQRRPGPLHLLLGHRRVGPRPAAAAQPHRAGHPHRQRGHPRPLRRHPAARQLRRGTAGAPPDRRQRQGPGLRPGVRHRGGRHPRLPARADPRRPARRHPRHQSRLPRRPRRRLPVRPPGGHRRPRRRARHAPGPVRLRQPAGLPACGQGEPGAQGRPVERLPAQPGRGHRAHHPRDQQPGDRQHRGQHLDRAQAR